MGLDACVYCNCFERDLLREPPPYPELLRLADDGAPEIRSDSLAKDLAHDEWEARGPCPHPGFVLVQHRIGNIALVGLLRAEITRLAEMHSLNLPILRDKVVYSGSHSGDWLSLEDVRALESEVGQLRGVCSTLSDDKRSYVFQFLDQLSDLISASQSVHKPVSF
jgi:hypothetical protein